MPEVRYTFNNSRYANVEVTFELPHYAVDRAEALVDVMNSEYPTLFQSVRVVEIGDYRKALRFGFGYSSAEFNNRIDELERIVQNRVNEIRNSLERELAFLRRLALYTKGGAR